MHPFARSPFPHQHMSPFRTPSKFGFQGDPLNRMFGAIGSGAFPRANVFSVLDNVQKVLKVAETMGPMIKQYTPAVKNLPSLMNTLKDFQSLKDKQPEGEQPAEAQNEPTQIPITVEGSDQTNDTKTPEKTSSAENIIKGPKAKKEKVPNVQKNKKAAGVKALPSRPKIMGPTGYQPSVPKLYI